METGPMSTGPMSEGPLDHSSDSNPPMQLGGEEPLPLEPCDLTASLRDSEGPDRHHPAATGGLSPSRSFRLRSGEIPTTHEGLDPAEWASVHAICQAFLGTEETCRLYPKGHARTRQSLKRLLQLLQEYSHSSGRPFAFSPEAALDLTSKDKSRHAKNVKAFAYLCRVHLVESIVIEPEVDLEELEEFIRILQTNPDSQVAELAKAGDWARANSWLAIRVSFYEGQEDQEAYHFDEEGHQLFPSTQAENTASMPGTLPFSLQRTLNSIFIDPSVETSLHALKKRLGLERIQQQSTTGEPSASVDLIHELVTHLFEDTQAQLDMPPEVLREKILEFLDFLGELVTTLPDTGTTAAVPHDSSSLADMLQRAAGLRSGREMSLAELFHQSSLQKKPPSSQAEPHPASATSPSSDTGGVRAPGPGSLAGGGVPQQRPSVVSGFDAVASDEGLAKSSTTPGASTRDVTAATDEMSARLARALETPTSQPVEIRGAADLPPLEPRRREPSVPVAEKVQPPTPTPDPAAQVVLPEAPSIIEPSSTLLTPAPTLVQSPSLLQSPSLAIRRPTGPAEQFTELAAIRVDVQALQASLARPNWNTRALQIELELLAVEEDATRVEKGVDRILTALTSDNWASPDEFLVELESMLEVLRGQALTPTDELLAEALCRQPCRELVHGYFSSRLQKGADLVELQPLLERMSQRVPTRTIDTLTALWKSSQGGDRDDFVDAIYALDLPSSDLARWAQSNPQLFGCARSTTHLRSMPRQALEGLLVRMLGQSTHSKLGAPTAAVAILKAVGDARQGEHILTMAIQSEHRPLRLEALAVIDEPRTQELLQALCDRLDQQNAAPEVELEETRLLITALLHSRRSQAREFLRRVRIERHRLRHVYRKEIREILELLRRVEGAEL